MAAVLAMQRSKRNNEHQQPQPQKVARFLITVTVLGSAGPLRFVVKEEELVSAVMETALRSYAREGRYPVLGYDVNNFFLYCANAGSEALSLRETIGSYGCRNFVLCKKQMVEKGGSVKGDSDAADGGVGSERARGVLVVGRKRRGEYWKAWINRSLSF
ncbi:hypothetical protein CKAN_00821600 [Cinnamomum micranthum f. kanehirae]|uniref:DUF7054 domain-containing protein n=1 Tax=Cinnamomum micranthum f. kanehirae TaxID=337451 RepID=A0A3S3MNL8_9MAGN|nr:hypothetical protein CKAN_00821600 [Cinnamomum micranthum f. kanehirae]